MDLMFRVPEGEMEDYKQFIVHTKYNCEVPTKIDEIDAIIPGDDFISRIYRWHLRNCILTRTHPYTEMQLKSDKMIRYEITRHLTLYPKMIHPTSRLRYFWEWFQVIFTYAALLIVPILNAFFFMYHEKWIHAMFVINLIFTIDLVLTFFTGYICSTTRNVILDSKLVTTKYLKSYFIMDLLTSFPMEIVEVFAKYRNAITVLYCSAFNLLIIFRLRNVLFYARNIQHAHRYPLKYYKFFQIFTIVLVVIHWGACLQYYVPFAIKYSGLNDDYEEQSWIWSDTMQKRRTLVKRYILCLNRAMISFVCSTHFLDSVAWEDILLNFIYSLIGKGGFIFLLVQTMHLKSTYTNRNEMTKQKQQLEVYTRQKKLPPSIQKRLHIYCNYTGKKHFASDKNILNDIPPKLKQELVLYNHVHMLTSVDVLKYLPQSIVIEIASLIRTKVYLTNDVIIQSHTHGQELYFIVSGTVAIYTAAGKEICHLEEGAHFGEITLVMEKDYRIASVIAIETCEVGILTQADFQKVIAPYPYIVNRLRKLAQKRLKDTLRLEEAYDNSEIAVPEVNISHVREAEQ